MRTHPVTIHRPAWGEDAYGNQVSTGYTDITVRARRVGPVRAREVRQGVGGAASEQGQQTLIVTAGGHFPAGTDIRETDEVTANGQRYKVIGVLPVPTATNPAVVDYVRTDLEAVR